MTKGAISKDVRAGNRSNGCNLNGAPTSILASRAIALMSCTPYDTGKNGSGATPGNSNSFCSASAVSASSAAGSAAASAQTSALPQLPLQSLQVALLLHRLQHPVAFSSLSLFTLYA